MQIKANEIKMVDVDSIVPNSKVFIPVVNKINKKSAVVVVDLNDKIRLSITANDLRIKNGYAFSCKRKDYLHRLIVGKDWLIVDHIDKNKTNCSRSNLRQSNYQLNKANSKPHLNRVYKGVRKSHNKYRSTIVFNGKQIHLGMFKHEIDAALAYNEAALKYYGSHAEISNV